MSNEKRRYKGISNADRDVFPKIETFIDCAGQNRTFTIELDELTGGYLVVAKEVVEGAEGYQFSLFSDGYVFYALGDLRSKIRKGLATRYLMEDKHGYRLTHDVIKGRISSGLVVDGRLVDYDSLIEILSRYDNCSIEIKLVPSDAPTR